MLKLAKHAVAILSVVAAASMPVAAHAAVIQLDFTKVAVTYSATPSDGPSVAVHPR